MKLCVGNLKGGVGKTKTAVHLALGLARTGRTLLVDADPEQPEAFEWSEAAADWPSDQCVVIAMASRDLAKRVAPMLTDYAHVVFDVGPKNPALLRQAMSLSDDVIVPCRPTKDELRELGKTFDLAAEVDITHPLNAMVLLVQVRPGMRSEADARELLESLDMPALAAFVRLLKRYEQSFGIVPDELGDYEAVLSELAQGVTA